jgi:hypothetical protein
MPIRKTKRWRTTATPPSIHDLLTQARFRLTELIEVCAKQRDAGELKGHQQSLVRAQRVLDEIAILEEKLNPKQR